MAKDMNTHSLQINPDLLPKATTSSDGLMSAADKTKLNNIKTTPIYSKTVTATTTSSGSVSTGLSTATYNIINAITTSRTSLTFWRGDGYIMVKDPTTLSAVANTSVTVEIIYCKKSDLYSE